MLEEEFDRVHYRKMGAGFMSGGLFSTATMALIVVAMNQYLKLLELPVFLFCVAGAYIGAGWAFKRVLNNKKNLLKIVDQIYEEFKKDGKLFNQLKQITSYSIKKGFINRSHPMYVISPKLFQEQKAALMYQRAMDLFRIGKKQSFGWQVLEMLDIFVTSTEKRLVISDLSDYAVTQFDCKSNIKKNEYNKQISQKYYTNVKNEFSTRVKEVEVLIEQGIKERVKCII